MIYPNDIVTEGSKQLLSRGVRILQGNRLADTEAGHVDELAKHMRLNGERTVADMGCGFGEVSRLLAEKHPDLLFYLINKNTFQLSECPKGHRYESLLSDMCETPLRDGFVDLVMFNYSLCHVDARVALTEAARITRQGGHLFVYDYERLSGDNTETEAHLAARWLRDGEFRVIAAATDWRDVETIHPGGDDSLFRELFGRDDLYDAMFKHLRPVIWRAKR